MAGRLAPTTRRGPYAYPLDPEEMSMQLQTLKQALADKDQNVKQLTARIQYTEEKAKRTMVSSDLQNTAALPQSQSKSMLSAKRVLALEQEVARLTNSKRELTQKMSRLVTELKAQKTKNVDNKSRLDVALKDVRRLNKKIGELEQQARMREASSGGAPRALEELPTHASTRAVEAEKMLQQAEEIAQLKQELSVAKAQQRATVDQDVENQKLRTELQAAKLQLAAVEAIPQRQSHLQNSADDLLAAWELEDWHNDDTGTWCLLDPVADAVYHQEKSSHAWPSPVGIRSAGGDERQRPEHAVSDLMHQVSKTLRSEDWSRNLESGFKDQEEEVGKQAAIKLLKEASVAQGTGGKAGVTADQLDALMDSLQLFSAGTVPRDHFERDLKDITQLYQQISEGNLSLSADATLPRLLARASGKKDQLRYMFRSHLDDSNSPGLGDKVSIVAAQAQIKECLGLDQTRDERLLLVLLLHWSISDTGYLPVAAIFRMLRLVSIEKRIKGQVVQPSQGAEEPNHRRSSHNNIQFVTDTQNTIERQLWTITQLAHNVDTGSFDPSSWHDEHKKDLGLLHHAKDDLEPVLMRLGSQSDEYLKRFKELQVKLQMFIDKHKELGKLFKHSFKKVEELMSSLQDTEAKARRVGKLEHDCTTLGDELKRKTKQVQDLENQSEQVEKSHMSEVKMLNTQVRDLRSQLREAQEAEYTACRKLNELIASAAPSQREYDLERQLAKEVAERKKLDAELERQRHRMSLKHFFDSTRDATSSVVTVSTLTSGGQLSEAELEAVLTELGKYKKLYQEVKDENMRLRAHNGDISQALHQEMRALQRDNCKLQQLLEKAESDNRKLIDTPADGSGPTSAVETGESDLTGLQPDENIFEVRIEEGELSVDSQVSTFLTLDFFDHATQVSTQQIGDSPKYNSTIQYVVQMNEAFFRYMASSTLKLELNQLLLSEWTEIGRASLSLAEVLNAAKPNSTDTHRRTLRVFGPGSVDLGKIKVSYRMLKPLPPFSHLVEEVKDSMTALQSDTLYRFAWHAQQHPSSSTGIQFPGYMQPVDTAVQHGSDPQFHEKRIFEFSPDPQTNPMFLSKLRETTLQLHVFDAAENGPNALVGTAQVSLQPLTEDCSREIDGVFELRSGSQTKGRITVALKWVQVLSHVVVPQTENGTVPRGGVTAAPDQPLDSSELENAAVLEFGLSSLTIKEDVLQSGDRVYAAFQFLNSPESVTQSILPPASSVNYTMRAKVTVDDALYSYMHTTRLEIRVHRLSGFHHQLIGRSFVPLCEVLENFASTAGMGGYSRHLPVMSAGDSNIIIGGLQMRLRSEHHSQWSYPGAHQCSQPISQLPADSEALVLVEKLQAVPASWPPGQDNYLAIAIHSVKLSHALQQQNFRKFQIFWNLLDSIVHAHQEATQELSSAASEVHVSHVSKYNLTPKDPSTHKARKLLLEKMRRRDTDGSLCFGLVARCVAGDYVAVTAEISLHDLRVASQDAWTNVVLPMRSVAEDQHVADVTITIKAHAILQHIWSNQL